jgi:hypothetical protein
MNGLSLEVALSTGNTRDADHSVKTRKFLSESLQGITPICATLTISTTKRRHRRSCLDGQSPFRSTISVKTGSCENLFAKQAHHRAAKTDSVQNKAVTRRGTKEKSPRECKKIFSNPLQFIK